MKVRYLIAAVVLLSMFAVIAFGADVTGKWKGSRPGRDGQAQEVTFTFKADGNNLTGAMTTQRGDREISEGKISGDEISFVMSMGQAKMTYKGKVAGDEIKFTVVREGGEPREFTVKKM